MSGVTIRGRLRPRMVQVIPARTSMLRSLGSTAALAAVVTFAVAGCGSGGEKAASRRASTTTSTTAATQAQPATGATSPKAAVTAVLAAEQRRDHDTSFALLSAKGREEYPDAESWARRRSQVPEITGFRVDKVDGSVVLVTVDHTPGLDPFVGLSTAHDTQKWTARRDRGSWFVDPEPAITLEVPDDAPAAPAAAAWTKAVQRCDEPAAIKLQVEPTLLGASTGESNLCGSSDAVSTTPPAALPATLDSSALVAQYGEASLTWARVVGVRVGDIALSVMLAPIGERWLVVGVVDA